MDDAQELCPTCGLPIGRSGAGGPLWTPQVKGVEVCGCPPEEEQLRAREKQVEDQLHVLEEELDEIRKHR